MELKIRVQYGITVDFPDFHDLGSTTITSLPGGIKKIARATYHTPNLLDRMIRRHPDDLRHLPMADIPEIIKTTGDTRPIMWLVEQFLMDEKPDNLDELKELASKLIKTIDQSERRAA